MAEQFYTILTKKGKEKIVNATALGAKLDLVKFQLGDGGGNYYNLSEEQTKLKNKVWEGNINSIKIDESNSNCIVIETIVPISDGGFIIREAGVIDDKGDFIAIAKYPETYKPSITEGSAKDLIIRMILEIGDTSNVTLKIDPSIVLATKKDLKTLENKLVVSVNDKTGNVVLKAKDIKTEKGNTVEERLNEIFTSGVNAKNKVVTALNTHKNTNVTTENNWDSISNTIKNLKTGLDHINNFVWKKHSQRSYAPDGLLYANFNENIFIINSYNRDKIYICNKDRVVKKVRLNSDTYGNPRILACNNKYILGFENGHEQSISIYDMQGKMIKKKVYSKDKIPGRFFAGITLQDEFVFYGDFSNKKSTILYFYDKNFSLSRTLQTKERFQDDSLGIFICDNVKKYFLDNFTIVSDDLKNATNIESTTLGFYYALMGGDYSEWFTSATL